MFQYVSKSPEATVALAQQLATVIEPGTILCLDGDLGAGKTLFVQALAKALGVTTEVTSPTFNLMNIYQGQLPIYHFDLYRLEEEYELDTIGFYDYSYEPDGLVVIEWANKFPACLPEDYIAIDLQRGSDASQERCLSFSLQGSLLSKVYKEMEKLCQF